MNEKTPGVQSVLLPLPLRQIIGPCPLLSDPYTITDRTLALYASEISHAACLLHLVRDTRKVVVCETEHLCIVQNWLMPIQQSLPCNFYFVTFVTKPDKAEHSTKR